MLEPLTALSLAASIIAFVDFGGKLVRTGYRIHRSSAGATEENLRLEDVTKDLLLIVRQLADSLQAHGGPLTEDDHNLLETGRGCQKLAARLVEMLEGLKVEGSGVVRGWRALRKTLEGSVMRRAEMEGIARQLDGYRQEISMRLLAILRNQQTTTLEELHWLEDSNRRLHDRSLTELNNTKRELLAALKCHQQLVSRFHNLSRTKSEEKDRESALTKHISDEIEALRQQAAPLATEFRILDSLYFERMHMRHQTIKDTYADTFAWIFNDATTNFKSWLQQESGIFWVRGKAGSGKSTLMKFLVDHERTPEILRGWAGSKKLVTASFYFWNAGTPMEKSQEGLLQSLLFQILKQCPELLPTVTPDRWNASNSFHRYPKPWSREELSEALERALSAGNLPARFCFFIDGLDEYAGDYNELTIVGPNATVQPDHHMLLSDLKALAKSPDVKLCVSSRPWNPFRIAFEGDENRMLILEELTREDMRIYIKGMLEEDCRFSTLAAQDPRASELISEIREKAQGVFLWVFLAVRSLLRGLSEVDDVGELQSRLRALPSDLKQFFNRILKSIDQEYRPLTCRMLVMANFAGSRLPLLAFWFLRLELDNPDYALQVKAEPLGPAASQLQKSAATSINKWCRDLLEIEVHEEAADPAHVLLYSTIHFPHRTVRDFLSDSEVSSYLLAHVGAGFDELTSLMRVFLAQIKLLSGLERGLFISKADAIMILVKDYELAHDVPAYELLKELDSVGQQLFPSSDSHWTNHLPICTIQDGSEKYHLQAQRSNNFLAFAVSHQLVAFVRAELDSQPGVVHKLGQPLLGYIFYPNRFPNLQRSRHTDNDFVSMFKIMLHAGADPNEILLVPDRTTVWQTFLLLCYHNGRPTLHPAVLAFLSHGADPDCQVHVSRTRFLQFPFTSVAGSKHTRIPSPGKEYATVEECLASCMPTEEVKDLVGSARQRANALRGGTPALKRWFSWMLPNRSA